MQSTQIICDHCQANLAETGNSIDWRLALRNEKIPSRRGSVTDMHIAPALKDTAHFCNLHCLSKWLETQE